VRKKEGLNFLNLPPRPIAPEIEGVHEVEIATEGIYILRYQSKKSLDGRLQLSLTFVTFWMNILP